MNTSESLSNIAAALCKVQASIQPALKEAKNPHLGNKYADLGSVWDACREALIQNNVMVLQMPTTDEPGYIGLTTRLLHSSGEWVEGAFRVPAQDVKTKAETAQAVGSALTYMRRYSLAAALGITQEDDDGHAASQPRQAQAAQRPAPQPVQRAQAASKPAPTATEHAGKASGEVIAINRALTAEYGFKASERENAISFVGFLANIPGLASTKDLTHGEARGVLKKLNACEDASSRSELVSRWADHMAQAGAA